MAERRGDDGFELLALELLAAGDHAGAMVYATLAAARAATNDTRALEEELELVRADVTHWRKRADHEGYRGERLASKLMRIREAVDDHADDRGARDLWTRIMTALRSDF